MLIAITIVIFILIVSSTWWYGLWSNVITLINLLIAAMVASSIYVPIWTRLIHSYPASSTSNNPYQNSFEFLSVWIAFVVTFVILRAATDLLSGYRAKFDPVTEIVGRSILSIWIAGVFICFSFFTLQMAPLPPAILGGSIVNKPVDLGVGPEKLWLAFVQSRSRGALAATQAAGVFPEYLLPPHPDDIELDARVFDPQAVFLPDRYDRRRFMALAAEQAAKLRQEALDEN